MFRLYGLLALLNLVLVVIALIDCLSAESEDIRALPRVFWVLLILIFSPVAAIVWFVAGRPVQAKPQPGAWRPGSGFPEVERPRSRAPDDDPEFLAGLAKTRQDDEDLLRQWEADLRRREDELRQPDPPTPDSGPDAGEPNGKPTGKDN